MDKKNQTISFKVSETMKEKAVWVEGKTNITFTNILRLATKLIIDYVEEHGQITMPFTLIPQRELSALRKRLAELEASDATPKKTAARR
ncbi:MAG: hypothetical protein LBK71_11690 [Verrucomicrobiales bacterium]|jgi:antitoxin component of RelBE/YafQ-DinJ toxin-antitoxin module|nr:hypothetical protein [Verrucomicrobiales bacterium]